MNFEYNISTGEDIISGSFFTNKELNFRTSFHSAGHSFDGQVLSGSQTVLASLNSQTLLEETPSVDEINNIKYFSVETGDFYVTKDTDNKNNLYFNGFDANRNDIILYDKKELYTGAAETKTSTGAGSWEDETISGLIQKADGNPADINDLFDNWIVFMNGQKVKIDDSSELDLVTGKAFAYKKEENILTLNGDNADIYGQEFLEENINLYVNGLKQTEELLMKLYTGVSLIKTGVEPDAQFATEKTIIINI